MSDREGGPDAVSAAPEPRARNARTNENGTERSAPGADPSATGESIRRHLPELAAFHRWIVRDFGKAPLHPSRLRAADASDRRIWCPLDHALTVWRSYPTRIAGVGFVLTDVNVEHPELRLVGIDLDSTFDELDELKPWAQRIVAAAGACYWERSPSGRGLRGFMRGATPSELTQRFAGGGVELYDGRSKRYLTVTGDRYVPA